jgi:hypothetical protein
MALTTYTELKAAVATRMKRSDLTTQIVDYITMFEAKLNRRLRVRQMETAASITPTAGVAAIPSDFLEARCVTWTGSPRRVLEYVTPQVFDATDTDTPSDTPARYTIQNASLKVMPVSNTVLEVDYYQKIPVLSAGNATNWLLTAHPDVYLYGATAEGYADIADMEKAQLNGTLADSMIGEIMRLDNAAQWGRGPLSIRVVGPVF